MADTVIVVNPSISQWVSTRLMADTVVLGLCSEPIHISMGLHWIDG